jgi:putative transposase
MTGIGSDASGEVARVFSAARTKLRHSPKFRVSDGPRRSLGWIPFRGRKILVGDGRIIWLSQTFRFWQSRAVKGEIKTGSFVQDARGRWYVTLQCETVETLSKGAGSIGIDLGLKALATCSNGYVVPALRNYRRHETALATAQRAGNKRRVKAIHAKIANARRDQAHKATTKIARENSLIVIGNVNAAQLKRERNGKSISDAGWSMFRNMLRYKASRHGARFIEADERLTSQTCFDCGAVEGPKGIAGLGVRRWKCVCGASHDRDVNAAKNILRVGLECQPPAVEIAA